MTGKPSAKQRFLETLLRFEKTQGNLNLTSVARALGVTQPAVVKFVRELKAEKIIDSFSLGEVGTRIILLDRARLAQKAEGVGIGQIGGSLGRGEMVRASRPVSLVAKT